MSIEDHLLRWIRKQVRDFSPTYFETRTVFITGLTQSEAHLQYDGKELKGLEATELQSTLSQVKRGNAHPICTISINLEQQSFHMRFMGMRGSGSTCFYTFELIDDKIRIKCESTRINA